jgi:hypothetical protein
LCVVMEYLEYKYAAIVSRARLIHKVLWYINVDRHVQIVIINTMNGGQKFLMGINVFLLLAWLPGFMVVVFAEQGFDAGPNSEYRPFGIMTNLTIAGLFLTALIVLIGWRMRKGGNGGKTLTLTMLIPVAYFLFCAVTFFSLY